MDRKILITLTVGLLLAGILTAWFTLQRQGEAHSEGADGMAGEVTIHDAGSGPKNPPPQNSGHSKPQGLRQAQSSDTLATSPSAPSGPSVLSGADTPSQDNHTLPDSTGRTAESRTKAASGQKGSEVTADSTDADAIELELAPGVKLPAVMLQDDQNLTEAQRTAAESIRSEFQEELLEAISGGESSASAPENPEGDTSESASAAWEKARKSADERYRLLYGDAAYNQMLIQSAIDATASSGGAVEGQPSDAGAPLAP